MSYEASLYQPCESVQDYTPEAALSAGEVIQTADGRAGVPSVNLAASVVGAVVTEGIFTVAKTADIYFIDGAPVYWDHSANKAYFHDNSGRNFFIGTAFGDAAAAATTMKVNLNVQPVYRIDLARDAFDTVLVGTVAAGGFDNPRRLGGSYLFKLTATNEAQKVDALSTNRLSPSSNMIVEGAFRMPAGGSGSASDFSIGLANATHASDADQITDSIFLHMDGGSTVIKAECDDGTNETNATDTLQTFTAGTPVANRVHFVIDCRDLSNLKFYINNARVLSNTTFSVAAMTNALGLLVHLEKTSGTEIADMVVDYLRVRTAQK